MVVVCLRVTLTPFSTVVEMEVDEPARCQCCPVLTDGNKRGEIMGAIYHHLRGCRSAGLRALCEGFTGEDRINFPHRDDEKLKGRGVVVVPPVSKLLACGDQGMGAMAEVEDVVRVAVELLEKRRRAEEQAAAAGLPPLDI